MKTVCMYCQRLISETIQPWPNKDARQLVSHGICRECTPKAEAEVDQFVERMKKIQDEKNSACKE